MVYKIKTKIFKSISLFIIGGTVYYLTEILWRGSSHISMAIVGGICFLIIGSINNFIPWELGLLQQSLIGSGIITLMEFISGLILNKWLDLNIWDYSNLPFNLFGQICLLYILLWIPLSTFAIIFDDWCKYLLFGDEKPHYKII